MADRIRLTRRRLLGAALATGLAGAGAGAGTMAAFTDFEASPNNSVQAGTLDLALDGADQTVTLLDVTGTQPGDQGQSSVTLGNAGSVAGVPAVEVASIRSTENGYYGQENGQDGPPNDGELDEHLELRFSIDGTTIRSRATADTLAVGDTFSSTATITGGGSSTFTVEWWLPSDTSNLAQSDGFEIDLTFRLQQAGP